MHFSTVVSGPAHSQYSKCWVIVKIVQIVPYIWCGWPKIGKYVVSKNILLKNLQVSGISPQPRAMHTLAAHRNKDIYVFGGEDGNEGMFNDVIKFSIGKLPSEFISIYLQKFFSPCFEE